MRALAVVLAVVGASLSIGCGGTAISVAEGDGASGNHQGQGGQGNGGGGTLPDGAPLPDHFVPEGGPVPWDGGTEDVFDEYHDPGCPTEPEPIYEYDCDPYGGGFDCGPNEGCYPYVSYPSGPCESEVYGSTCAPAGSGEQGDSCDGGNSCAPGFVCVVTGAGVQCAQLCKLNQTDTCPGGRVCESLDVAGMGVCM